MDVDRQISRCELAVVARVLSFTELLGQHFSGNILQKKRQNEKYSLPGVRGLGPCNLSLESEVLPWFLGDSSGQRPPNQSMLTGCRQPVYKVSLSFSADISAAISYKRNGKRKNIRFLA